MNTADKIAEARACLKAAGDALSAELCGYPPPVAGCDDQYNLLLEERNRVRKALAALDAEEFTPTPRRLSPDSPVERR
ncbi:MAG: hypothetical protein ACYYKD_08930 [Rhodospirillales bacterium]